MCVQTGVWQVALQFPGQQRLAPCEMTAPDLKSEGGVVQHRRHSVSPYLPSQC